MIDIGWVIDNRISKLPLPDGEPSTQKQLGLDIRGHAVGGADAAGFTPDESRLVVTCTAGLTNYWSSNSVRSPGRRVTRSDFPASRRCREDKSKFRRIKLGGRPAEVWKYWMTITVVVANYLSNSLQIVDIDSGDVTKTIELGGPSEPNRVRQGEALFYDADRSMHSWFSCHTCHTEGHTAGQMFDTRNDRSFGTPKLTPSLRGVAQTGPWTWHGWQTDLQPTPWKRSLSESMATKQPVTDEDAARAGRLPENAGSSRQSSIRDDRCGARSQAGTRPQSVHRQGWMYHLSQRAAVYVGRNIRRQGGRPQGPRSQIQSADPARRRVQTPLSAHRQSSQSGRRSFPKYHRPEDLVGEALTDEERESLIEFLKSL